MNLASAVNVPTLVIAGWGALVSTALAIRQFALDRRRVKVIVLAMADATHPNGIRWLWAVRVVNVRQRPVEIEGIGLTTPEYDRFVPRMVAPGSDEQVVFERKVLNDGESTEVYFPAPKGHPRKALKGAWARDTLGAYHTARWPPRSPAALLDWWKTRRAIRKASRTHARKRRDSS